MSIFINVINRFKCFFTNVVFYNSNLRWPISVYGGSLTFQLSSTFWCILFERIVNFLVNKLRVKGKEPFILPTWFSPFEIYYQLRTHNSEKLGLFPLRIVNILCACDLSSKNGPLLKTGRFWCIMFEEIVESSEHLLTKFIALVKKLRVVSKYPISPTLLISLWERLECWEHTALNNLLCVQSLYWIVG